MIVSTKKKGSAVVEFATVRAAVSTQLIVSLSSCSLFTNENLYPQQTFAYKTTFVYLTRLKVLGHLLSLIIAKDDTCHRFPSLRTGIHHSEM